MKHPDPELDLDGLLLGDSIQDIEGCLEEVIIDQTGGFAEAVRRLLVSMEEEIRDYVGASSVESTCIVKEIFKKILGHRPPVFNTFTRQLALLLGTAVHQVFQNYGPLDTLLYGVWQCSGCKLKTNIQLKPDSKCHCLRKEGKSKTSPGDWEFLELEVKSHETNVLGHIDGIVRYRDTLYLLDIKTIASRYWKEVLLANSLEEFKPEYVTQVNIYLHLWQSDLCKVMRHQLKDASGLDPLLQEAIVFFVCPGERDMKSFTVRYDKEAAITKLAYVDHVIKAVGKIDSGGNIGKIERICSHKRDKKAFFCEYKDTCFSDTDYQRVIGEARRLASERNKRTGRPTRRAKAAKLESN